MITLPVINGRVSGAIPRNAIYTLIDGAQCRVYLPGDTAPKQPQPTPQEMAAIEAAREKEMADTEAARQYAKLKALSGMSPTEVQAWVSANVTNLAQAQDAIATLTIAVSVLARRL